ncbi:nicotinate-nucleotide--dimethylbenzimidazole phosphoribosyltransferase [Nocardiopsis nanhaiensis]
MTDDDREDARPEEGTKRRGSRSTPGLGGLLGGLLDGLPESGKGTKAQEPKPSAVPNNPFRRTAQEPTPEPEPAPAPEPAWHAAPAQPQAPQPPAHPGPAQSPPQPQVQAHPPAAPPSPPAHGTRPNVIPFRGGNRNPDGPPPGPQTGPQPSMSQAGPPQTGPQPAPPYPEPPTGQAHPASTTPPPPAHTTIPGHTDASPMATDPEQSDTVHAHQAAAPLPEPEHTGPPQGTGPQATQEAPTHPAQAPSQPQVVNQQSQPGQPTAASDDAWQLDVHAFEETERAAVYRAIRERRDVRAGFRPDPVPVDVLTRVLDAAHQAPSVGHTQPWDFLVIDDPERRALVRDLAENERDSQAHARPGPRAQAFSGLKVEAVLESPLNIAVTVDPTRGAQTAGRHSKPASYSAALAVENLWLAARTEGLGVGWVAFADERDVARVLELPSHLEVVAYLCVGYVEEFPTEPELSLGGWAKGRPLSWAVHRDRYGRRGLPGQEPTTLLEETITAIGALNARAVEEASERQARMTKPQGSLGILEEVSIQLAGLAGECPPPIPEPAAVAVFAGDHGVFAQGVTAWPQEVTAQMVQNFLDGGAVVNAFAEQVGAEVTVVDVGVVGDLPNAAGLLPRKVSRGTTDFTQGPAMTRDQALQAIEGGIEVARDLVSAGNRCLVTGDMGIGNTTPAAALFCAFTGADPSVATGRGTGLDDATYEHKVEVVRRALQANPVAPEDPIGTLAALGGLEHAALTGFILGGAALRVPVLLDGVAAGAAALAAASISPESLSSCFAGHRSAEPGHGIALEYLGLTPLVDLEMRLGEGSGALLALPLLQASARALRNVATFDTAGVSSAQ